MHTRVCIHTHNSDDNLQESVLSSTTLVLGLELGPSGLTVSAFIHWATSPAHLYSLYTCGHCHKHSLNIALAGTWCIFIFSSSLISNFSPTNLKVSSLTQRLLSSVSALFPPPMTLDLWISSFAEEHWLCRPLLSALRPCALCILGSPTTVIGLSASVCSLVSCLIYFDPLL